MKEETPGRVKNGTYRMSFSTGGLFLRESERAAALYRDFGDWTTVRDKILAENLLRARTLSTLKRLCRELVSRLKTLSDRELGFLIECSRRERGYLLWIAACRQYAFVADFALEILRERYITLKIDISNEEFDSFFIRKSEWRPELDEITPATRIRLRQNLFQMLREADLLTADNMIISAMPSPGLLDAMSPGDIRDVFYLPVFESDLKGVMQ
mgnify:CR=1 FL=1